MSLMYSINPEINGKQTNIDQDYTINVMISGFGIFFGPILTGIISYSSKLLNLLLKNKIISRIHFGCDGYEI